MELLLQWSVWYPCWMSRLLLEVATAEKVTLRTPYYSNLFYGLCRVPGVGAVSPWCRV